MWPRVGQREQGLRTTVESRLGTKVEAGDRESEGPPGDPEQGKLGPRGEDWLRGGERKQKSHLNICLLGDSWPWEESCFSGYVVRG